MSLKHKVLKDFQFVTTDKKIVVIKAKTVLENYKYKIKNDSIFLEKDVVDNNPEFFAPIDWKEELNIYIKQNKIPSPAILTKKLIPFIEDMFILEMEAVRVKESFIIEREKEVSIEQSKIDRYKEYWDEKAAELQNHHNTLKELQKSLEEKEQNLHNYINKDELIHKIQEVKNTYPSNYLLDDNKLNQLLNIVGL